MITSHSDLGHGDCEPLYDLHCNDELQSNLIIQMERAVGMSVPVVVTYIGFNKPICKRKTAIGPMIVVSV